MGGRVYTKRKLDRPRRFSIQFCGSAFAKLFRELLPFRELADQSEERQIHCDDDGGVWLFANGVVCFQQGYKFFMIALADQKDAARVVRELKGLLTPATAAASV